MSEWKPFFEIVKLMKEEDVAESKLSKKYGLYRSLGYICEYDIENDVSIKPLVLHVNDLDDLYRIRPRYVSQEEAFKSLSEGGTIRGYDDEGGYYEFNYDDSIEYIYNQYPLLNISDIVKFKWVIVE
ncbi:hypothetical protein ABEY43_06065 [Priestia megaterium]